MIWLFLLKNWRLVALGILIAAFAWWHNHEMAISYRQGATDREASALQEAAAKVELDTAARKSELDARAVALDAEAARTSGERAALNTARAGISTQLQTALGQLSVQGLDARNEIASVPDSAVNARFRAALEHARIAERERLSPDGAVK